MKFLRRSIARGPQADLKPATFDAIFVSPVGHNTKVSDSHFEIILPGLWTQVERETRTVFEESNGRKQMFLSKLTVEGKVRTGALRNLIFEQATRKQQVVSEYSKYAAQFSSMDARKIGNQEDLRFHGFDPSNQVAFITVFRANPQLAIDFSIYQYGLSEFDPDFRREYQPVLDSIKLK